MLKHIYLAVMLLVSAFFVQACSSEPTLSAPESDDKVFSVSASGYNVSRAELLIDDIFRFTALIEGDNGEGKPYFCGIR